MKTIRLFLWISFVLPGALCAQSNTSPAWLQDVLSTYTKGTYEVTFSYRITHRALGLSEEQSGQAIIQNEWYRIRLPDQDLRFDGTTTCLYYQDAKEVTLMNQGANMQFSLPHLLAQYEKDFEWSPVRKKLIDGEFYTSVSLRPQAESHPYQQVELLLDGQPKHLRQLVIQHKDGQEARYTLSVPRAHAKQKISYYRCDRAFFSDCEWIDLR